MSYSIHHKRILLLIDREAEAHRSPELARQLIAAGAHVKAVLSRGAEFFTGIGALESITGSLAYSSPQSEKSHFDPPCLSLSRWADAIVAAPAGISLIGELAHGISTDLLSGIIYHFEGPVLIVPSIYYPAFDHPAVSNNLAALKKQGYIVKPPEYSPLLNDEGIGIGRTFDPAAIAAWAADSLYSPEKDLEGITIIITAGPTIEEIDPVRYISNRSSGRMGIALAVEVEKRGASVICIHGPVETEIPRGVREIPVKSAAEMFSAVKEEFPRCQAAIMSAAVADFKPLASSAEKIKKGQHLILELTANPDILAWMGQNRKKQILIGFALEDTMNIAEARRKLKVKNCDLIVLNTAQALDSDESKVILIGSEFEDELPPQSKTATAKVIIDYLAKRLIGNYHG